MQLALQRPLGPGLHRSSGLQKAQAIRMTKDFPRRATADGGCPDARPPPAVS